MNDMQFSEIITHLSRLRIEVLEVGRQVHELQRRQVPPIYEYRVDGPNAHLEQIPEYLRGRGPLFDIRSIENIIERNERAEGWDK
jgi:hypothetical protein